MSSVTLFSSYEISHVTSQTPLSLLASISIYMTQLDFLCNCILHQFEIV